MQYKCTRFHVLLTTCVVYDIFIFRKETIMIKRTVTYTFQIIAREKGGKKKFVKRLSRQTVNATGQPRKFAETCAMVECKKVFPEAEYTNHEAVLAEKRIVFTRISYGE